MCAMQFPSHQFATLSMQDKTAKVTRMTPANASGLRTAWQQLRQLEVTDKLNMIEPDRHPAALCNRARRLTKAQHIDGDTEIDVIRIEVPGVRF